ncbi:MAG TPA: hypothetical protein DCW33_01270, partial [Proteobacteria bacterium]|nr:hypothetical protein [Pseudomonadota bacterium]
KLLGESAYQSTQMKSLIPATLNIEKQIGPITQSTFHDSFEINEKHSSSDILFLPHLGASNGEYPFSIIPLSVLRDQPVPAKETDTPAPRNRKSDALVRTYKIDRQIDPYTKEEIPRHHLVTMGLKPKRDAIIPYDDQSTAGDSIDQVARIIEDGIDDQWHLRNIEHLDVEVQSKIQDIKRLIEEMPYAKAPNRKQAISRVRRLMREINESDKEDGRFSNINLLYAFHQAKELDEDVQLSRFSKQHGVLNQLRDNKEKSQEKVSLYAAIHKLNGWGESTSAIDAVTSLAYLATAATDKKIQQRAATLIIHAYLYEDIHYINSYGEKHLRFNPELYEQESQSYHENVRNKEIDANDHINGIIDLSDPQRELEKLYEAGDAYAGILLVQLCLSNRFAHHRKVDAYDNDINKACKILIQCTNKEQPKNPLAQLLYGVCLKYGIGFTKSPYRGKDYIAKVNGDDCITESLIHTDLLAFQLGRFSYEFMIKGYAYQLCNRKPIHQEIAESIEKRKALTDLQIRGGSITRISFNTTARNAILQMGILFNIPGVLEECNQKKPSIKPGEQKLSGKESADDKSIIERIQLAIKNGFDVLYECNEPFYILVKHVPFRDHFIEKVAGSTNTSLRGSLKIR